MPKNNNWEKEKALLWRDFITRVYIFCGQENKADTSDLELIFDTILAQQEQEFKKILNSGRKMYELGRKEERTQPIAKVNQVKQQKERFDRIWGEQLKNTPMAKEIWAFINKICK